MSDARKRALDEDSSQGGEEDQSIKRVAKEEPLHDVESVMVMKVLCPDSIVGAIIGRGGSTLTSFQETTNSKIKVSQNSDYFPETSDRVIVITGQPDSVTSALGVVIGKICETILYNDTKRSDSNPTESNSPSQQIFCVRLLIPHGASGVIIGRSGANIKEISTLTSTRLQLGDSADPFQTKERIVSITGSAIDNIQEAAARVLTHLMANRSVGTFINNTSSYKSFTGGLQTTQQNSLQPQGRTPLLFQFPNSNPMPPSLSGGFMGPPPMFPSQPQAALYNNLPSPHHSLQPHVSQSAPYSVAAPLSTPTHASMTPSVVTQISAPDNLIGAVLGKGGSVLKAIMNNTGARIKVSQKGDYIPGTTNRSISIEGTQDQVQCAHSAILTQLNAQPPNSAR